MFYKDDQETIISRTDTHGDAVLTFISKEDKLESYRILNSRIVNCIEDQGLVLTYKNKAVHMVAEAMNRVPMYCNALTSRGYHNILFVGHFWTGQYEWILERSTINPRTTMYDQFPPERDGSNWYPDIHILLQFIPIFMKQWKYHPEVSIVRPPEPRHKGIIHHLYNKYKVAENLVTCNQQYQMGMGPDEIAFDGWDPENKYDALVFLGVPRKHGTESFTMQQVKDTFGHMLTPNAEIVDIWNQYDNVQSSTGLRFFMDHRAYGLENRSTLSEVFHCRSTWDKETRNQGIGAEFDFMKRFLKFYSRNQRVDGG